MPRRFRAVARVLNPAILPLARRLPPLAVVHCVGRRSGTPYRNPVMAFRAGEGWVIALAYGADVQWLRNAEAAGRVALTRAGKRHDDQRVRRLPAAHGERLLPLWARHVMRLARVRDYVLLDSAA